jgi:hypothetical protein
MSDPQPQPGKHHPPRAEPLQPDHPHRGGGDASDSDSDAGGTSVPDASSADEDPATVAAQQERDRSEHALKNVREGYG